ncbi:MAG TPA: thrombospondin type 3 repeat-containing protein [Kofleriaceae bacterium]|nr:thrombospondin type 3 repeat-containing protein [Kofleriaceae bacterium]
MRRIALVALVVAGCNQVFDLQTTTPAPPADAVDAVLDTDSDGVIDLDDNCRNAANPSQHDEDHDGVGDLCDNCPLVENHGQADVGEAMPDGVGDACDPHPTDPGDCLLLLDTFVDPAAFANHWQPFLQLGGAPALDPQPDRVRITPVGNYPGGFVALDDQGQPLTGTFGVQLLAAATFPVDQTEVGAVSNGRAGEPLSSGLLCAIVTGKSVVATLDGAGPGGSMSATAVGSSLLLRLVQPTKLPGSFSCRADYGLSVGATTNTVTTLAPGLVGAVVHTAPEDIEAIAIYEIASPCPTATFR